MRYSSGVSFAFATASRDRAIKVSLTFDVLRPAFFLAPPLAMFEFLFYSKTNPQFKDLMSFQWVISKRLIAISA